MLWPKMSLLGSFIGFIHESHAIFLLLIFVGNWDIGILIQSIQFNSDSIERKGEKEDKTRVR